MKTLLTFSLILVYTFFNSPGYSKTVVASYQKLQSCDSSGSVLLNPQERHRFIGVYHNSKRGRLEISEIEGQLSASLFDLIFNLTPQSNTELISVNAPVDIIFNFDKIDQTHQMQMVIEGHIPLIYKKIPAMDVNEAQLHLYVGDYYCDDLRSTYSASIIDGNLYFLQSNAPQSVFEPIGKDRFRAQNWIVNFTRDAQDHISSFILNSGGEKNIQFIRTETKD